MAATVAAMLGGELADFPDFPCADPALFSDILKEFQLQQDGGLVMQAKGEKVAAPEGSAVSSVTNSGVEHSVTSLPLNGVIASGERAAPLLVTVPCAPGLTPASPPDSPDLHAEQAGMRVISAARSLCKPSLPVKCEPKGSVSHSTIEKQRRDRINSLIDELRDIVPPQTAFKGPNGEDLKRPKHMVLSDTITLIRQMHEQVLSRSQEIERLSSQAQMGGSALAATPPRQLDASAAAAAGVLRLPQPPRNAPLSVGVVVEEAGDSRFHVRVNCKDRAGLLSDITAAIQELPLHITRAAITTSADGAVCDVFEVAADPDADPAEVAACASALDLQLLVHTALYRRREAKRARIDGDE